VVLQELFPYPWSHNEEFNELLSEDASSIIVPGFYTGPPPFAPKCTAPTIPPAAILAQQLIKILDKLFFISNSIGSGDVRGVADCSCRIQGFHGILFFMPC
jgi:hypothetical protein